MRTFIALDIDEAIRQRVLRFVEGVREFAPEVRWVRPESLHLTLKFVGEKPADTVEKIKSALSTVSAKRFDIGFRGYGFFPSPKSARVFWVGIEAGPQLTALAQAIEDAASQIGIPPEEHRYSPHLTLARGGGGSGSPRRMKGDRSNPRFQRLIEKLSALSSPEFGTMTAREFFLYESQLLREGGRYVKIARFGLGPG